MAKADDTSSTIDWIWLRDALELAVAALGSVVLAKERLKEWLAAGKLPWSCMSWEGLDAEGIAKLERESRELIEQCLLTSHRPRITRATLSSGRHLKIDWEDNGGARATRLAAHKPWGSRCRVTHLLALLPEEPREGEEVRGAGAWIAAEAKRMKEDGEIPDGHQDHRFCNASSSAE